MKNSEQSTGHSGSYLQFRGHHRCLGLIDAQDPSVLPTLPQSPWPFGCKGASVNNWAGDTDSTPLQDSSAWTSLRNCQHGKHSTHGSHFSHHVQEISSGWQTIGGPTQLMVDGRPRRSSGKTLSWVDPKPSPRPRPWLKCVLGRLVCRCRGRRLCL